jgi:hypothetical protein
MIPTLKQPAFLAIYFILTSFKNRDQLFMKPTSHLMAGLNFLQGWKFATNLHRMRTSGGKGAALNVIAGAGHHTFDRNQ